MKFIFFSLLFVYFNTVTAQEEIPKDYFQDPLDVNVVLSGTFGELRSNHFHSGLDIKTQQQQGLPVHASAKGYVSRIKVSHYGYGKALYIQHPNGYTTVYGHLKSFSPEIKEYVRKLQYENESYEVETFPASEALQVDQGELIAYSGNTGGSGGPHVHFEIRDAAQRPMNPLMFGIEVPDSRTPLVTGIFAYPLGESAHVNNSARRQELDLIALPNGNFKTESINACGNIGFGISTVDQLDEAYNRNGVFNISSSLNGDQVFEAKFDKFSFSETRYLNQYIDYAYYEQNGDRIQKLFVAPNNPLSIFRNLSNRGVINVKDSLSYNYIITVSDYAGNERSITIPIQGKIGENVIPKEVNKTEYFVNASEATHFEKNGIDVYIPANSLYEDTYLDITFGDEKIDLHKDIIPIHRGITIGFDVSAYKPEDREQMFIAEVSPYGSLYYNDTYKEGDRFTTSTRTFGTYTLARDTEPPTINPVNFKDGQWISNNETLKVKINDDLSGIGSYRATVNGEFILMEYEYKDDLLTYYFSDGTVTETENKFELIVVDNVGNTAKYEATFFRKE